METRKIIKAIKKLPISQRILIIEQTLKTIRENETGKQMEKAATTLYEDYENNRELTEFTALDYEAFYEAR
jgi:hypothetical protein